MASATDATVRSAPPDSTGATTSPCDATSPSRGRVGIALGAFVVVGGFLRLWQLGAQRLGFDEAFTAMTARRSPASMFAFLRIADSHPPLSYLIRAPFGWVGATDFWIRFPSAAFSIGALALFAVWMRRYGWTGVAAVVLFAVSTFEVVNGRNVRMYAELELVGVAAAYLADVWLRRPRRWHAVAIAALTLAGLLIHVSMFLLGAGLVTLAGFRTDRDAWRWRIGLALGVLGWAVTWGPSFLVQARTGHSDWIPRTTFGGFDAAVGGLITTRSAWHVAAIAVVALGGWLVWRRDRVIARVWTACFAVPVLCAALVGFVAPVLLDRVLTVMSWGAVFAVAVVLEAVIRRARLVGLGLALLLVAAFGTSTVAAIERRSVPDVVVRHLQAITRPGDVVAVHPARRRPEILWPFAVTLSDPTRGATLPGLAKVSAFEVGTGPATGRAWLVEWRRQSTLDNGRARCAPDWHFGATRIMCLAYPAQK